MMNNYQNYYNNDIVKTAKKTELRKRPKEKPNEIVNFYEIIPKKYLDNADNPNYDMHKLDLPFRMCVVAPSGSGKTNFVINLIRVFSHGKGTFADITIVTRNKDEPLYNWLASLDDNIIIVEGMQNNPKLDDYDKKYNHLLIWDDLVLSKNLEQVCEYYLRARKKNVSLMFLSQSYADIPKMIRKNSSYLVLFDLGGSNREQNYILKEWSSNLENYQLRAIYEDAVSEDLHPLIIKGGKSKNINEKYRKGFINFYNLSEFLKDVQPPKKNQTKKIKKPKDSDSDSDSEY